MPTEARGNYLPEAPYLRETKTYHSQPLESTRHAGNYSVPLSIRPIFIFCCCRSYVWSLTPTQNEAPLLSRCMSHALFASPLLGRLWANNQITWLLTGWKNFSLHRLRNFFRTNNCVKLSIFVLVPSLQESAIIFGDIRVSWQHNVSRRKHLWHKRARFVQPFP